MIHAPGGMERDGERFHHAAQKGVQFKIHELFISGIFHVIFLNHEWPQVTETSESKTTGKGAPTTGCFSGEPWLVQRMILKSLSECSAYALKTVEAQSKFYQFLEEESPHH